MIRRFFRILLKPILWFVGIWAVLLIVMEVTLSQSVLTGLVNKYATEYIDGDLRFGKVSISMFRRFPNVSVSLEDFSITYPADRFDSQENEGLRSYLVHKGCGQESDTLASFRKFTAAVNVPALITGNVRVPYVRLDRPRIFAHSYADGSTNWNMFGAPDTDSPDESAGSVEDVQDEMPDSTVSEVSVPKLSIGRIRMSGNPYVVYTDSRDTVFASISMRHFEVRGNMVSKRAMSGKVGLSVDSMFVGGRVGLDTLALALDHLYLHEGNRQLNVDVAAKALMATRGYGRMMVPVNMKGTLDFPRESPDRISTDAFVIDIASVPFKADADIVFADDGFDAEGGIHIDRCNLKGLIDDYAVRFMPEISQYSTDVFLGADMSFDISSHDRMKVNATLENLTAEASGLAVSVQGKITDLTGKDPEISIDGRFSAALDSLTAFLPDTLEVEAAGVLAAQIQGNAKVSQLDIYNFSNSSLNGIVTADSVVIRMPKDTINAQIDSLKIVLGPEDVSLRDRTLRLMGVTGTIAKADVSYKDALKLNAEGLLVSAKNSVDGEVAIDSLNMHPFAGQLKVKKLSMTDSQGTAVRLVNSTNRFSIMPKRGQAKVPVLTLTSRNERITLRSEYNRASLVNANVRASAAMNTVERRQKARAYMDSLAKVYPDIPRDSLLAHMMKIRGARNVQLPSWIQKDDFRKQDIDISLDKTLAGYFREWDLNGGLNVEKGMVMSPYFPVRNTLGGFDLKFTNDDITINKFDVKSGDSDLSVTGRLTGLRRALLGRRGALKLDVDVISSGVNANQLLMAYTSGMNFNPEKFAGNKEGISDEQFMKQVEIDTSYVYAEPSLIVIPGNLMAEISLDASNVTYSDLAISKMTSELVMKERCVQISDTKALTNMGDISAEGFYSTRTKKDIKAGFSLNFKDITAEKVISLMPAVDTLMPLLKSFGGLLNCEVAATASLDTNMNIIMPSINGIMRMGGENLTVTDNDMFRKLAGILMFRNKNKGQIDKMTVEGVIKDSRMEIFPFVLEMDRYMLGLSGVQNMDMSFRYHASLIKSPLLIKLGMDVYGPDFDNMKFKLGKAKYKSRDVPVFTDVIDDAKVNLVESIRHIFDRGIDAVMNDKGRMKAIEERRKKIGYVQAVDQKLEELSDEERTKLEEEAGQEKTELENNTINE